MSNAPSTNALSNNELRSALENLVRQERKITAAMIEHIAELDRRQLHLAWGFGSLFDYLARGLGYSESAAYRRMQAARALRQMPEIKDNLEDGSLKICQVAQVQTSIRREEKQLGHRLSVDERREIFHKIEGKTSIETQKVLDVHLTSAEVIKPQEKHKRDDSVELNLRVPKELFERLQRVKELYAHIEPGADWVKILELMAKDVVQKRDPLVKKGKGLEMKDSNDIGDEKSHKPMTQHFAKSEVKREPIPVAVRRAIFERDKGQCQFRGADGHVCGSRHQAEIDHIKPVSMGGRNDAENLRILCRAHNVFRYSGER